MLRPTQDYILVRPIDRVKSSSLIVVEDEKPCEGVVMAVGPGKEVRGKRMPLDVKVGETVRFKYHTTYQDYREDGVDYLVIREPDVEGIVEG